MNTRARRWSDHDHYWGPFTFAAPSRHWRPTGVLLCSGEEDYPGASLRFMLAGWTMIVALPEWTLRPHRERVYLDETYHRVPVDRSTRNYVEILKREYGFMSGDGHLSVSYGRATCDSSTEQRWGWFYPWRRWRHVRHSLYRPDHRWFADMPQGRGLDTRNEAADIEARCPTISFAFTDFDGEPLTVTCRIEEREWRLGEGKFKWLSLFRRPRIQRTLDLRFSGEVGKRKGSWKGGTLGHSIELRPGEEPREAFRRYCDQHSLTFKGVSGEVEAA